MGGLQELTQRPRDPQNSSSSRAVQCKGRSSPETSARPAGPAGVQGVDQELGVRDFSKKKKKKMHISGSTSWVGRAGFGAPQGLAFLGSSAWHVLGGRLQGFNLAKVKDCREQVGGGMGIKNHQRSSPKFLLFSLHLFGGGIELCTPGPGEAEWVDRGYTRGAAYFMGPQQAGCLSGRRQGRVAGRERARPGPPLASSSSSSSSAGRCKRCWTTTHDAAAEQLGESPGPPSKCLGREIRGCSRTAGPGTRTCDSRGVLRVHEAPGATDARVRGPRCGACARAVGFSTQRARAHAQAGGLAWGGAR